MIHPRRSLAALSVLAMIAGGFAGTPPVTADSDSHLGWTAESAPFRLIFTEGRRPLAAQASGTTAGPGGRMAYALADGSTHRLTNLIKRQEDRDGTTYTIATDEPGRTAEVTVRRNRRGVRVGW